MAVATFGFEFVLDAEPDAVAGLFLGGFEQLAGLVGDVLEIADQGGAVIAGVEVSLEDWIVRGAPVAGGEELRELVLELRTGDGGDGSLAHRTASLRAAGWVDCSGSRSSSRSLSLALCSWDLLLPVEHSSMVAISLCSKPSTS